MVKKVLFANGGELELGEILEGDKGRGGPNLFEAPARAETDLERCVRQIREQLANPNPNNPKGLVVCKLEAHEHIDLVAAELTRDELLRVRFQVKR